MRALSSVGCFFSCPWTLTSSACKIYLFAWSDFLIVASTLQCVSAEPAKADSPWSLRSFELLRLYIVPAFNDDSRQPANGMRGWFAVAMYCARKMRKSGALWHVACGAKWPCGHWTRFLFGCCVRVWAKRPVSQDNGQSHSFPHYPFSLFDSSSSCRIHVLVAKRTFNDTNKSVARCIFYLCLNCFGTLGHLSLSCSSESWITVVILVIIYIWSMVKNAIVSSSDLSTVTRHPLVSSRCNSPDCVAHCSFVLRYVAMSVYLDFLNDLNHCLNKIII